MGFLNFTKMNHLIQVKFRRRPKIDLQSHRKTIVGVLRNCTHAVKHYG